MYIIEYNCPYYLVLHVHPSRTQTWSHATRYWYLVPLLMKVDLCELMLILNGPGSGVPWYPNSNNQGSGVIDKYQTIHYTRETKGLDRYQVTVLNHSSTNRQVRQ